MSSRASIFLKTRANNFQKRGINACNQRQEAEREITVIERSYKKNGFAVTRAEVHITVYKLTEKMEIQHKFDKLLA